MIRSCFPLVLLLGTTVLYGQRRIPTSTARRAVDFATWQHTERVLREKMLVVCAKPHLIPKEKAWCLLWNSGLHEQLSAVRRVEQVPPYDTLARLLAPFSATRIEAAYLHAALSTPLSQRDSVEAHRVLTTLRTHLVGPDTILLASLVPYLQGTPTAPIASRKPVPVLPQPVVPSDALVPAPDATPWKIATSLALVLALSGWGYAWGQRRRAERFQAKAERLRREFQQQKATAWFDQLSALRTREEDSMDG